jgi:phage protein U
MAIASFSSKVFQVNSNKMYTFQEFQYTSSLQTDKQDVAGSKPSTYNKGPDLDSMSFKLVLDVAFGVNPRKEWDSWKAIMNSGMAYPFILGGRALGSYKWLLTSVSPSNVVLDGKGNILSLELDLKFDEFVRAGSAQSTSSKKKSSTKAKAVEELSDSQLDSLIE